MTLIGRSEADRHRTGFPPHAASIARRTRSMVSLVDADTAQSGVTIAGEGSGSTLGGPPPVEGARPIAVPSRPVAIGGDDDQP